MVATKVLVGVMEESGIKRYVDVTGTGVRFPADKITLIDRFLNMGAGIVDPARAPGGFEGFGFGVDDHVAMAILQVIAGRRFLKEAPIVGN